MKLKLKFMLIFLTMSAIPIFIITAFTYDRYTKLVNEQTTQIANTIFEKAVSETNDTCKDIKNIVMTFNFYSENSESIIDSLKKYTEQNQGYTSYDIMKSNQDISFICRNFIFSHDYINGIYIFTPAGPILGYGTSIDINPNYTATEDSWYQKTLDKQGRIYVDGITTKEFILHGKPSISFSQGLYDVYTHEFLGVLFIECNPSLFDLSDVNTLPEMALLAVQYEDGNLLYTNVDDLTTPLPVVQAMTKTSAMDLDGISLVFSVNFQELYREFGITRIVILAIAFLCLLVFAVLSVILSHTVTKPIIHLSHKMSIRDGEHLQPSEQYLNRPDEIGILYTEYNHMVETLNTYIKKELQNKLITLDSQMKSLEAQINSHFLYNTLESINSIAEIEEVESISIMSLALGDMFRYSIKTKSELVSIADEIKHVNNYVSIQQIRFDNQFQLILDIPEEMYTLKVLKLILQPLVENAFYHGLNYCRCGSYIKIRAWQEDENLYLSVSDDGVGMTNEQLAEIESRLKEPPQFTELGQRNNQSIGIKNIHARIILYYGEGYGLQAASCLNQGTTMTIKLPIVLS